MVLAHRIRIDPNNVQATYLARAAGTARFAYNWALVGWRRQYEASKADATVDKLNEAALRRQLNAIKARAIALDARSDQERTADGDHAVGASIGLGPHARIPAFLRAHRLGLDQPDCGSLVREHHR
ncbi:helix-turn-helix domain-containing protein [Massilia sp. CFBP9012]|uniref:helix-turn-helix domain-containing protein n=1 Tax=Massilia sp. CFBP9012 TaxID=3096531 RepID=UPI002A6B6E59|nr:helix-turn-helix domain-containing protein [Massilia sp. CFBP9012]MDY0975924.1 helix-turn-helix domain-containing protein [Massilia sp. CFBP9012]